MPATVITIAIEKGGTGKTVTASNLAYLMGDEGKKVLCVDTDPQGNLTTALSAEQISSPLFKGKGLYNLLDAFKYRTTDEFIMETNYENVDMIPCNAETPRINKRIDDLIEDAETADDDDERKNASHDGKGYGFLEYFLNQVKDKYDYIIIDTQPTRDAILLMNALAASDFVLIPMIADSNAEQSAFRTFSVCNILKNSDEYHLKGAGVFVSNFDKNSAVGRLIKEQCERKLGDSLFKTVVPSSRSVSMSVTKHLPVCYTAKTQPVAKAFVNLYSELKTRIAELEEN